MSKEDLGLLVLGWLVAQEMLFFKKSHKPSNEAKVWVGKGALGLESADTKAASTEKRNFLASRTCAGHLCLKIKSSATHARKNGDGGQYKFESALFSIKPSKC